MPAKKVNTKREANSKDVPPAEGIFQISFLAGLFV